MIYKATNLEYQILAKDDSCQKEYPLLRANNGTKEIRQISPIHCRSYLIAQMPNGRYVISKGNGLGYSKHNFLYTLEMPTDVWGLLLKEDALRDFYCGQDVQALWIKTNQMECVLELDYPLYIEKTGKVVNPVLLQYNVECPYRIADAPFMNDVFIWNEVSKWERYNTKAYQQEYLIAADVLIHNLRIMHDHKILHNALTNENLTWALELLDFELTRTPQHPYTKEDYERHAEDYYSREILDIYRIIHYIAGVLHQDMDYNIVDDLFKEYGFDLKSLTIENKKDAE